MSETAFLLRDGRAISRGRFLAGARALAKELAAHPPGPLMPLCARRGDLAAALVAANRAGRAVVMPHDDDANAIAALRERAPDALPVHSEGQRPVAGTARGLSVPDALFEDAAGSAETLDDDAIAWRAAMTATLFTSGSTGAPVAHAHGPAFFAAAAEGWGRLLAVETGPATLIPTVPSQHMYGFEAGVLLPLGDPRVAVLDARPFFPADIRAAIADAPGRRILITTPLHLRALVEDGSAMPPLDRVVTATAPLARDLAARAEDLLHAPVIEIYGSTETGMLAARRTAREDAFTPRADVAFRFGPSESATVSCGFLARPFALTDRLRPEGTDGAFALVGRDADVLKVAGKRASLAGVTAILQALPEVRDAALLIEPGSDGSGGGETGRPTALVVPVPGATAEGIRRAMRARISGLFVPRRIVFVDAIPRTALGKVRATDLRALLDGARDDGPAPPRFTIPADHPALPGHFPGNPIVPGAVILDRALDAAGIAGGRAIMSLRFQGMLRPEEACAVTLTPRGDGGATLTCARAEGGDRIMTAVLAPTEGA